MRIKYYLLFFFFMVMIPSCVDEYWPVLSKYENLLVVDGLITDAPGPYTVRLSFSSVVKNPKEIPCSGCQVTFYDDSGDSEMLTEEYPGTYVTSSSGIRGVPGHKYMIRIYTPEGKTYESPFQELKTPIGIDSVYAIVEYHQTAESYHDLVGYQFYINTHLAEQDTNYYLWQLEETYEYTSDFTIDYIYIGHVVQFHDFDSVYRCWKTENVYGVFTSSTIGLAEPRLVKFPLHYVDTETRRLFIRYSLFVRQLTIDKEAFRFWDEIRNLISENDMLYTKQPFQVRGNINNVEDSNEPVLGYFTVAGQSQRRVFFDRPLDAPFYFYKCEPLNDLRLVFVSPSYSWPIYLTIDKNGRLAWGSNGCFDCTLSGGTTTKPDFWKQ
jgi:hypothetical protein